MTKETKTIVVLRCDLHGGDVEAQETVSFGAQGTTYEMELCAEHLAEFNETMAAWTAAGRLVASPSRRRRSTGVEPPPQSQGEDVDLGEVREWARAHDYEVSDRGRLAQGVLDAYRAAQGQST